MSVEYSKVENYLKTLQRDISEAFGGEDTQGSFIEDRWERPEGGEGLSCVYQGGDVIESFGVNFSHVFGENLPPSASATRPELAGRSFRAMGVSVVCHPSNPYVPTSHANVRLFVASKEGEEDIWWFGGGFDMTPYYGNREDCAHFHKMAKAACEGFLRPTLYEEFKQEADAYFFLKHRGEPRGVGGIFYDDLNAGSFEECFAFMRSVGEHYIKAYQPILARRKDTPYGERERKFQLYRRGRYVEFNLIYDRGTIFGLQSGGRTESILMSLPAEVNWRYNYHPEAGTPEAELYDVYLKPQDWANMAEQEALV